jgi:hypothetical protein
MSNLRTASNLLILVFFDIGGNIISRKLVGTNEKVLTATAPANTASVLCSLYTYSEAGDVQLELGSTATDYEPYKGSTYSVNWESEAGTVYGGTLDVVSGKLTVDRFSKSLAIADMNNSENYPGWNYSNKDYGEWIKDIEWGKPKLCSIGVHPTRNIKGSNRILYYVPGSGDHPNLTQSEWKSTYPDLIIQIVDYFATPITYQLTPQEVHTLLGENNIWSDSGDISVEYPADTKMYINKKITEAIAAAMA